MDREPSRRDLLAAGGALGALALANCGASSVSQVKDASPPVRDPTLAALLAKNRENHPVYGGGLANHLSMELCALAALGATAQRLNEFSADYSKRLTPFPGGGVKIARDNWRAQLRNDGALHGFAQYFESELRSRGRDVVLREVLEVFAPTVSSELFHCMIRTAYGVQFDDDAEIAHGLAYWAIMQESLGALGSGAGSEHDFAALLARVRETPALAKAQLTGNSNPGRMLQASRLDGFAALVDSFAADDKALDSVARASLELYAATRSFVALHAVTSTHALRILLPYFPDRALAVRYQAQALIAAYIRMGAPAIEAQSAADAPAWEPTVAKAVASADDHDAKFVYACRDEQSARGGDLYRVAAARRVDRA